MHHYKTTDLQIGRRLEIFFGLDGANPPLCRKDILCYSVQTMCFFTPPFTLKVYKNDFPDYFMAKIV